MIVDGVRFERRGNYFDKQLCDDVEQDLKTRDAVERDIIKMQRIQL